VLTGGRDIALPSDLVVDNRPLIDSLNDERISAVVVGPGLGRDDLAREALRDVLYGPCQGPTVIDADALHMIGPDEWPGRSARPFVLTPHAGELAQLNKAWTIPPYHPPMPPKLHDVLELNWLCDATIVAKGPDTIVFDKGLGVVIAASASSWLSVAGSGDVLAGLIACRMATGEDPLVASEQALWLHGEAARLAGPAFTASELADAIKLALASCL